MDERVDDHPVKLRVGRSVAGKTKRVEQPSGVVELPTAAHPVSSITLSSLASR
jgi:hypothetical protein